MKTVTKSYLVARALLEFARYDLIVRCQGSGRVLRQLRRQATAQRPVTTEIERTICEAVLLATCLYWKPVLCLQRSVATARLLRKHGVAARLAIGYRPSPFFSHAWVEVDQRVVNGSAAYPKRLRLLHVA